MFILFVIGLLVSVILSYQLPQFPPFWLGFLLLLSAFLALYLLVRSYDVENSNNHHYDFTPFSLNKKVVKPEYFQQLTNFLFGLLIGFNLVFWQQTISPKIEPVFFNQQVVIEGEVSNLANLVKTERYTKISFDLDMSAVSLAKSNDHNHHTNDQSWSFSKPKVRLNWYISGAELGQQMKFPKLGEHWRFRAKLKSNHAAMNASSRDYEAWLFHKHLQAKANVSGVKDSDLGLKANRLSPASSWNWRIWRQQASDYLHELLDESPNQAIYRALLIGDKSAIAANQWQLFQQTGTIHLMAISGLHMGIMAFIGMGLFRLLWSGFVYRQNFMILPTFSALGGVLFATAYLLVSGGAIPTQRAWIMVVTVVLFLSLRRKFRPWSALAMAALLVLLWDSRAILSSGFWLSFGAVALIFISLKLFQNKSKLQQLIAIQFFLTAGLAPLIYWHFYELPIYSLFANLVAVPFVSFIGLPLLVVMTLIGLVSLPFAETLFVLVDWLWQQLWDYLAWLASLATLEQPTQQLSIVWLIMAYLLLWVLLSLFQKGRQQFGFSVNWVLPVLVLYVVILLYFPYSLPRPNSTAQNNQAWVTVLDVGQGQAVVVETVNHVVLYDTGAKWGTTTDAAQIVVNPFLKARGWSELDLLMVSHSDIDHSGGALSVLQNFKVKQQVSGQAVKLQRQLQDELDLGEQTKTTNIAFAPCISGDSWVFDGIRFDVLAPEAGQSATDNDMSCVLKITNGTASVLISGDLGSKAEVQLIEANSSRPDVLNANLLVAGHHGSKHSSSLKWLQAVQPESVVFSAGYLNRYHFPAKEVIQRLEKVSSITNGSESKAIRWWNTACSGALTFELNESSVKLLDETRKSQLKWYHHSCLPSQQGIFYQ